MSKDSISAKEARRGPFAQLLAVPAAGFRWEDWPADGEERRRWLVPKQDDGAARRYPPLAQPDLHRRLARLRPTESTILRFADRYGRLGHGEWLEDRSDGPVRGGELLASWADEIAALGGLLALWDLVRQGRTDDVARYVHWHANPKRVVLTLASRAGVLLPEVVRRVRLDRAGPKRAARGARGMDRPDDGPVSMTMATIASSARGEPDVDLLERWPPGDVVEPARYYICGWVNQKLRGHVSPAVHPFLAGEILWWPDCLLAACYVCFMLELSGRTRQAVLCARPGCGRYFTPEHGRQRYHEDACRKLAYYHRQAPP